jgi:hypothetical protein
VSASPSTQWVNEVSFTGVKRPMREPDNSFEPTADVNYKYRYTSASFYASMDCTGAVAYKI